MAMVTKTGFNANFEAHKYVIYFSMNNIVMLIATCTASIALELHHSQF